MDPHLVLKQFYFVMCLAVIIWLHCTYTHSTMYAYVRKLPMKLIHVLHFDVWNRISSNLSRDHSLGWPRAVSNMRTNTSSQALRVCVVLYVLLRWSMYHGDATERQPSELHMVRKEGGREMAVGGDQ